MTLTLLIGGARSGKSAMAERLAAASRRPVLFVATMEGLDDETALRIAAHRSHRPQSWRTIEVPANVVESVREHAPDDHCVILDCLTMWVSNMLIESLPEADRASVEERDRAIDRCVAAADGLAAWAADREGETIVVTNEVGSGVVPAFALGRAFRDALGRANATLASRAGQVFQLTAGLAVELKSLGAMPIESFGEAPSA